MADGNSEAIKEEFIVGHKICFGGEEGRDLWWLDY